MAAAPRWSSLAALAAFTLSGCSRTTSQHWRITMYTSTEARLYTHTMHVLMDFARNECEVREYVRPDTDGERFEQVPYPQCGACGAENAGRFALVGSW